MKTLPLSDLLFKFCDFSLDHQEFKKIIFQPLITLHIIAGTGAMTAIGSRKLSCGNAVHPKVKQKFHTKKQQCIDGASNLIHENSQQPNCKSPCTNFLLSPSVHI